VRSLPQPVSIFETMGRSVGWLAAASVLAKSDSSDAPHLVYLPEKPFEIDRFLADVDRVVTQHGWAIAVVSEGLRSRDGTVVHETTELSQQDECGRVVPGNVGTFLAEAVTRNLKIRCRSEKPGLCGRTSMLHVSEQDHRDAELVGRAAVRAAMEGRDGQMVSLLPLDGGADGWKLISLASITAQRGIPQQWLNDSDARVGEEFVRYAQKLVGALPIYAAPLDQIAPVAKAQAINRVPSAKVEIV